MSRVVIIGITPDSLALANTLKLMNFDVTCFEQKDSNQMNNSLQAAIAVAKKNQVHLLFSTPVKHCTVLEQDKGVELTTPSVTMTVPSVICAFGRSSNDLLLQGDLSHDDVFFLERGQAIDLSPFTAQAQMTKDAVAQWLRPNHASKPKLS